MLSIEELAEMEITTVARRLERVHVSPSAISVVTGDDIRRAGAPTIPDALRLATGVHVGRVVTDNINSWAVGVRGFNLTTTNKLLVLRDGRSLYSPLFSGVFWDVQGYLLEDIDRIEVIRGPGATMWGANAVNGVINIMTKDARDTQGLLVSGGAGDRERGLVTTRYGGQVNDHTWYRVYARGWEREDVVPAGGSGPDLRSRFGQGGFRMDSRPDPEIHWTLQGDLYEGRFEIPDGSDVDASGANVLGRWRHAYGDDRRIRLQAYYDHTDRDIPDGIRETRDTAEVEIESRFPIGERQEILWGTSLMVSRDDIENTAGFAFIPEERTVRVFGLFLQDRITLLPDSLHLTLGSKFEHNTYSGFEHQPSARLGWLATERQFLWGSVSRAMRTPARIDTEFQLFANGNTVVEGNPDFRSERLYAYEAGYRVRPADPVTFDLALFYNDYDHLRSLETTSPPNPARIGNLLEGETYGFELSAAYQALEWWRLRAGYMNLQKRLRAKAGSTDDLDTRSAVEGNDPEHVFVLQSAMDLGESWTLDGTARLVSRLPDPRVPSYSELDLRLAYFVRDNLEVSLTGRNLLEPRHREFGSNYAVPRSVFFRVKWEL